MAARISFCSACSNPKKKLTSHSTPAGQAIGLVLHSSYDPKSKTGLLVVGSMNAISSVLLIFASLVELMAVDFLSDESWKVCLLSPSLLSLSFHSVRNRGSQFFEGPQWKTKSPCLFHSFPGSLWDGYYWNMGVGARHR